MVVNNFSLSTIKGYTAAIKRLHNFHQLPTEQITEDQLVAFICHLKTDLNLSAASMRIAVGGIKYFYTYIINRKALTEKIPYPKKEKHIRTILTGGELKVLFEKTTNLKHRLILKIAYSGGLRRSEILSISPHDIDWKNMQLIVRQGKGRKDRYTLLAHDLKEDYQKYIKMYSPKKFLFFGREKDKPLSENATRWIMDQAKARAKITKSGVCFHSLRHSFATHLLAIQTDVVTVQILMGHNDIRTTMEYFHLGNRPSSKAKSPLDIIFPQQ
jgi:integrase/recombinase XerD